MSFDVAAKYCLKISPIVFSLFIPKVIFAQEKIDDTIIITADRIKSTSKLSASDVVIFDSKKISENHNRSLTDLLSQESDLSLATEGVSGSHASIFLRGAGSAQTLVVVDGIVMNDPSNPNRQFDIGKLSLNNIEKVEILKGSQGMAYGSNAIGGVIIITSKSAKENSASGSHYIDYGTYNTLNAGLNFQKGSDLANISMGADFMNTDGFSAANKNSNPNAENDSSKRTSLNFNANKDLSKQVKIGTSLHYVNFKADLDDCGGVQCDTPNFKQTGEDLYAKVNINKTWDDSNAETQIIYAKTKHHRSDKNSLEAKYPNSFDLNTIAKGEIDTTTINHTYNLNEDLTQNIDLSFSEEKDNFNSYNSNLSTFLYHQLELSENIFNFGIRLDHNKLFNDHLTYKVAAAHAFENSLLKLTYSTGFQAPSLNQLFDPTYGNKDLSPETSQSVDLGYNFNAGSFFKSTTSIFATFLDNRLSYDPNTYINRNFGKAEIYGLEEKIGLIWFEILNQSLAFSALKTKDLSTGKKLARRPDFTLKNNFAFNVGDNHHFDYDLTNVSVHNDVDNLGNEVKAEAYLIHDLGYRFSASSSFDFYFKVKNIFDLSYEEIYGFGTAGRAITLGAQYKY